MNSHSFKREMTITHADFFRLLPRALGSEKFAVDGDRIEFNDGNIIMRISISAEQNWKIGALSLPKTRISMELHGCDEREAQQRISKFDRTYQKGGG